MYVRLLLGSCFVCFAVLPVSAELDNNPLEATARTLGQAWQEFADPPAAFRLAPLYVWNDDMQEEEIARQLADFAEKGIGSVFVHPRPGLVTPYLSEGWRRLFRFTALEAAKHGMLTHIYDENSYPSGFAGGLVPEAMPESRRHSLVAEWFEADRFGQLSVDADTLGLFRDASTTGQAPEHFRLTIQPDGRTGALEIDGRTVGSFVYLGEPLSGGVGFRSIVGRHARVDDVRFYQTDPDGKTTVLLADDFDRHELGPDWVVENLTEGAPDGVLKVGLAEGVLSLRHEGGMFDTWLRTAAQASFAGKTTVFEFRLIETSGDRSHNPALVVGARPYQPGETRDVLLLDVRGRTPVFGPAMRNGQWTERRVRGSLPAPELETVLMPSLERGEVRAAAALGLAPGRYLRLRAAPGRSSPWFADRWYVDLMMPGVTEKFLEITLGAYDAAARDLYGKSVVSCFTDEPSSGNWTPLLPEIFQQRWDYSLSPHLPALFLRTPDFMRVRHDYYAVQAQLFMERFAGPFRQACQERNLAFTGHVWEHEWPWPDGGTDGIQFAARQHIPGIDCLMNQYSEAPHGQFGNHRATRSVASAANQMGRRRVLCEAYGAAGWELTLEDMKRIGDFLLVGGVNLLDPHLTFYTIRGARKRDHPQSFSYHAPWWEDFRGVADYLGRVSWALSSGEEKNRLLLLEPSTTAWLYAAVNRADSPEIAELAASFHRTVIELSARQLEFDLGSELLMAEAGKVVNGRLTVGRRGYECVALPEGTENLESSTLRLLEEFLAAGGSVAALGPVPGYVDGRASDAVRRLAESAGESWKVGEAAQAALSAFGTNGLHVAASSPRSGRVYHLHRQLEDGRLLFISNCSAQESATASVVFRERQVQRWDAETGKAEPVAVQTTPEGARRLELELPPAGSVLLAFSDRQLPQPAAPVSAATLTGTVEVVGELHVSMEEPNVLPLDYVDLVLDGTPTRGLYFFDAQTRIYRAHGFQKNPWDNSVQFKDELLRRDRFPDDSGFVLRYPFTLEGFATPPELELVVERGDRYAVSINEQRVEPVPDAWWLDRSFRVYRLKGEWLKSGENVIETAARPFSLHMEPEPVYLRGNFSLETAERGWTLRPASPLEVGSWHEQGRPTYPGAVRYRQKLHATGTPSTCTLALSDWKGSVARVEVNGRPVGQIAWQPWRLQLAQHLSPGENTVDVIVVGSLRNLLGPHHAGRIRGTAWPGMFQRGGADGQPAGDRYDVLPYGLLAPFTFEF